MLKSVIATTDNITLYVDNESIVVNRIKNEATFEKVLAKVKANDLKWLEANVKNIKSEIESKTDGVFAIDKGVVVLKGTDIPVPEVIVKKLIEMEKEKEPILPLLRFWRKLASNPSANSRENLYEFMTKNNIPITEEGDIVTEKGVLQKKGSFPGDLVDNHTKSINNSVGMTVEMPREKVNADSNQTCSSGLHVAAPDYVRNNWTCDVIVECIVNPADVVSVPKDYNATKMRVCKYRVAGYSRAHSRNSLTVVKLSDFFSTPLPEQEKKMGGAVLEKKLKTKTEDFYKLGAMSAKKIVDLVKELTGEEITLSLKSKKSIVKKAEQILEVHNIKSIKN